MKKIFFSLLLILPLVFNSCSSDDDDDKPSLKGTQWEMVESGITATISYLNDTECTWVLKNSNGNTHSSEIYNYTYDGKLVVMTPQKSGLAVLECTINGSSMKVFNTSTEEEIGIYIKK